MADISSSSSKSNYFTFLLVKFCFFKWQPNVEEEPIEKSQPQQQPAKKVESKKKR